MAPRRLSLLFGALVFAACAGVPVEPAATERGVFVEASTADRAAGAERFPFSVRGQWGYIDRAGEVVVEPGFAAARPFSEGRAAVRTRSGWGFADPAGRLVVAPTWTEVSDFADGRARVATQTPDGLRYGFVDAAGTQVLAPTLRGAYDFAGGLAPVQGTRVEPPLGLLFLRAVGQERAGAWQLVGTDGRVMATTEATALASGSALADGRVLFPFERGRGFTGSRRWGWLDGEGRAVIAARLDAAGRFAEGLAPAARDGRFGYVDATGAFRVEPAYDVALPFSDGLARVLRDGVWGYLGPDGAVAVEPSWDAALDASGGRAAVQRGGVWGYLGPDGTLALPLQYAFAAPFRNGLALVRDDRGLAYIDTAGGVVWRGE